MNATIRAARFHAAVASVILLTSLAHAQPYTLDWFSLDGGGGQSAGGPFAVSGTIGQAAAGMLSGGSFTVVGGFWGVVQVPEAPRVEISLTQGVVTISWLRTAAQWNYWGQPSN